MTLFEAILSNNFEQVKYLIERGADVNVQNENNMTPLLCATYNNNFEMVKYFVEKGANINIVPIYFRSPLGQASLVGNFEMVKYFVTTCGSDINFENSNGDTCLIEASYGGHLEIVKYLITTCGANINHRNKRGYTPLVHAFMKNNFEIIEYLITEGADINNKCCLSIACHRGYLDVVKLLVENGAEIDVESIELYPFCKDEVKNYFILLKNHA